MNYNLSPKARAMADTANFPGTHHSLIESPHLEYSLAVALAEYAERLARDDKQDPAAKFWKLAGAHEYIFTLRNLAETAEFPKRLDSVNLSQNQK